MACNLKTEDSVRVDVEILFYGLVKTVSYVLTRLQVWGNSYGLSQSEGLKTTRPSIFYHNKVKPKSNVKE